MNQQRYGTKSPAGGREVEDRSALPVDDIGVVPANRPDVRAEVQAAKQSAETSGRPHLRAVERPADSAGRRDPVGAAVETVGAAVGWTAGYVKTRRPSDVRSDAERIMTASPGLALVAALGFGFLLGSYIRR